MDAGVGAPRAKKANRFPCDLFQGLFQRALDSAHPLCAHPLCAPVPRAKRVLGPMIFIGAMPLIGPVRTDPVVIGRLDLEARKLCSIIGYSGSKQGFSTQARSHADPVGPGRCGAVRRTSL